MGKEINNMKQYLIFAYGEFEDKDIQRITNNLSPITDGKAFKFLYSSDHIIFHFSSEYNGEFLQQFIFESIHKDCLMYFLVEKTDNLSHYLPKDSEEYLFDLETIEDPDMVINGIDIVVDLTSKEDEDSLDDDDEDISEIDALLIMNRLKKDLRKPTLDEILDKIVDEGELSLTPYEKAILEKYSHKL
jgi:hypothetical protein